MARYRKIDPRMWGDEKFRSLSKPQPNAQTLWIYLLTGPHTNSCPGLYHIGEKALAEALGWELKAFRKAFQEAFREGMVEADWEAHVIFIPNVILYDYPPSPNVVKFWGKCFDEIPECNLKVKYYQHLKAFLEGFHKGFQEAFVKAFVKPFIKPLPIPEPEPEPEPREERGVGETKTTSPERASTKNDGDFLSKLKQNLAYSHIDINNELRKMDAWLSLPKNKGRKKTGKFMLNWLNKIEKPMEVETEPFKSQPSTEVPDWIKDAAKEGWKI